MGETHSPSVAHMGYDISPLSRVKLKLYSLQWRNIVTHGQLKGNIYSYFRRFILREKCQRENKTWWKLHVTCSYLNMAYVRVLLKTYTKNFNFNDLHQLVWYIQFSLNKKKDINYKGWTGFPSLYLLICQILNHSESPWLLSNGLKSNKYINFRMDGLSVES